MRDFGLKKLYYSISEVSKLTGLEQYILRYWETEFEQLKPQKNRSGNRIYTNKDIELILEIKKLLREKKYTVTGAKKIILEGIPVVNDNQSILNPTESNNANLLNPLFKNDLLEIKQFLLDLYSKL